MIIGAIPRARALEPIATFLNDFIKAASERALPFSFPHFRAPSRPTPSEPTSNGDHDRGRNFSPIPQAP